MLVTASTLECVILANCTLVTVSTIVVLSVVLLRYTYISTVAGRSPLEILDTCRNNNGMKIQCFDKSQYTHINSHGQL